MCYFKPLFSNQVGEECRGKCGANLAGEAIKLCIIRVNGESVHSNLFRNYVQRGL